MIEGETPEALARAAGAARARGDRDGEMAALDALLALRPRDVRALLIKGERLAEAGDRRGAAAFRTAALKAAPVDPPPDLRRALERAAEAVRQASADYEDWLRAKLEPMQGSARSERFAQSLDLLFGRKTIYRQSPRIFYFPELPQRQFYRREECPWLDRVEAATDAIRAEFRQLAAEGGLAEAYVQAEAGRPVDDRHWMLGDPDWSAIHLWKDGAPTPLAERCPATAAALSDAPLCRTPGRTPTVLFSLLKGGATIPPHTGYLNTRLICHLPLVVPAGDIGFRVGNDVRRWEPGRAWAFDDTIEHEAWNCTAETRAILIFDVWRPELTEEERGLVSAMFEAIDAYGGGGPAWSV